MRQTKIFCDIDGSECDANEFSVFTGSTSRMNAQFQLEKGMFEGHYCAKCTKEFLAFIEQKRNAKDSNIKPVGEQTDEGTANKSA